MTMTIDMSNPVEFRCGEVVVRAEPPDRLVMGGNGRVVEVPGLDRSQFAEVWTSSDWCCVMGLRGPYAVVIRPTEGEAALVGPLDRLDLSGRYDPGGLEHVEFHPVPDGDVLLVTEVGVARISALGGLVWRRAHDDLAARCVGLADGVVWFESETEAFGYDVETGDPRFRTSG